VKRELTAGWIAAALLLLPLAGCEHSLVARNMGNAYRENMSAQIADPEAGRANEPGPEGLDGATGEGVMENYRRDQGSASQRRPGPTLLSTGSSN
jgi:hypothetical protein